MTEIEKISPALVHVVRLLSRSDGDDVDETQRVYEEVLNDPTALRQTVSKVGKESLDILARQESGRLTKRFRHHFLNHKWHSQRYHLEAMKDRLTEIQPMFGRFAEFVIHDLRGSSHHLPPFDCTAYAIIGNVTGRRVGDPMPKVGVEMLASGKAVLSQYVSIWNGKQIKSASLTLRDEDGEIFGMLCINLDLSLLESDPGLVIDEMRKVSSVVNEEFHSHAGNLKLNWMSSEHPGKFSLSLGRLEGPIAHGDALPTKMQLWWLLGAGSTHNWLVSFYCAVALEKRWLQDHVEIRTWQLPTAGGEEHEPTLSFANLNEERSLLGALTNTDKMTTISVILRTNADNEKIQLWLCAHVDDEARSMGIPAPSAGVWWSRRDSVGRRIAAAVCATTHPMPLDREGILDCLQLGQSTVSPTSIAAPRSQSLEQGD